MKRVVGIITVTLTMLLLLACGKTKSSVVETIDQGNKTYKVEFDSNGGTSISTMSIGENQLLVAPSVPEKKNFDFIGWYKEKELINQWNFGADKVTQDITLYAKWNLIGYSLVRGGTFIMGNTTDISGEDDEIKHKVTLTNFYIGKTEVTFEQFDQYTTDKKLPLVSSKDDDGKGIDMGRGKQPVINVSWWDAIRYANWLSEKEGISKAYDESTGKFIDENGQVTTDITKVKGYRLPTEAEWEYAARERGKNIIYAWGNEDPIINGKAAANIADETYKIEFSINDIWKGYTDNYARTAPVASFVANELGLYDVTGNVSEWCNDFYGDYVADELNPLGVTSGDRRIIRGGEYYADPPYLRVAYRSTGTEEYGYSEVGFRLARSY